MNSVLFVLHILKYRVYTTRTLRRVPVRTVLASFFPGTMCPLTNASRPRTLDRGAAPPLRQYDVRSTPCCDAARHTRRRLRLPSAHLSEGRYIREHIRQGDLWCHQSSKGSRISEKKRKMTVNTIRRFVTSTCCLFYHYTLYLFQFSWDKIENRSNKLQRASASSSICRKVLSNCVYLWRCSRCKGKGG